MPAMRGKNLRAGDITEQLGLLLLQNIALVAPVPRTEDVGIDAVITLLEDFNSKSFIATDTFFLQIKSNFVEELVYEGVQVKWLYDLELPFFIASVNKSKSSIDLYCCHQLSNAYVSNNDREKIVINFNNGLPVTAADIDFIDKNDVNVPVGPPILSWTLEDVSSNNEFRKQFNEICKEHIHYAKEDMITRDIGHISTLVWKTNQPLKDVGYQSMCSSDVGKKIDQISDSMMPYFAMLMDESVRAKDLYWPNQLLSLSKKYKLIIEALQNQDSSTN